MFNEDLSQNQLDPQGRFSMFAVESQPHATNIRECTQALKPTLANHYTAITVHSHNQLKLPLHTARANKTAHKSRTIFQDTAHSAGALRERYLASSSKCYPSVTMVLAVRAFLAEHCSHGLCKAAWPVILTLPAAVPDEGCAAIKTCLGACVVAS